MQVPLQESYLAVCFCNMIVSEANTEMGEMTQVLHRNEVQWIQIFDEEGHLHFIPFQISATH